VKWGVVYVGGFLKGGRIENVDGFAVAGEFECLWSKGCAIGRGQCGGRWGKNGVRRKADACVRQMAPGVTEGELLDKLLQGDRGLEDYGRTFGHECSTFQDLLLAHECSGLFTEGLISF
jgi:hypothetical protein